MKLSPLLCVVLAASFSLQAAAEELPVDAQRLLDDLGPPEVQQKNNGKKMRCIYGGSKIITVSILEGATIFSGDYNNCRESGPSRDGYVEVMVQDGEIVGESSRRSINGELHDAVRGGDLKKAKTLLRNKADVNYAERIATADGGYVDGWTPLMSVAMAGNADMAKLLIKAGAWVNYLNSRVVSALWLSAGNGNLEVVKLLVAKNAYVNNRNIEEVTPLMNAAMNGHYDVVEYLLGAKADVNLIHKDGDSALMFAVASGRSDIARALVDFGADVNIQNKFGVTALIIAAAEGNEEIVRNLIEKKVNVSAKTDAGKTALDVATAKGYDKIVVLLKQAQGLL